METQTAPRKKPGPHARQKAREAAAATASPLKERAPKPDRPPRVSKFVDRPFSEELQVPLTPSDFTNKTHVMLKMYREREGLEAEFDTVKANYKQRLKSKDEEIIELQSELQSGTEKRVVPLIARYYPGEKRKVILDPANKNKRLRDEPMTPAELREVTASQPMLLNVPAPAAVTEPQHVSGMVQGALDGLGVPGTAAPKEGEQPPVPGRTNPTTLAGINVDFPNGDEELRASDREDVEEEPPLSHHVGEPDDDEAED